MSSKLARPVLLYDAGCRFCRWSARVVFRLDSDRRLAFLPLGDPRALPLLTTLEEHERFATWRLALHDGSLVGYGAGLTQLLGTMRRTSLAAPVVSRIPDSLLDSVYGMVARHRETLGKLVPNRPGPSRYP